MITTNQDEFKSALKGLLLSKAWSFSLERGELRLGMNKIIVLPNVMKAGFE